MKREDGVREFDQNKADFLIIGEWVWVSPGKLLKHGAVAVSGDVIAAAGPAGELLERFPNAKQIGGEGCFVFPGMIDTHTHLFQTFLKGLGKGLPLRTWVQEVTTPAALALSEKDAYLSAMVGLIDALHSGTTSVFEFSYAYPNRRNFDAILQAFSDIGIRGWLSVAVNDTGSEMGVNPALIQTIDDGLALLGEFQQKIEKMAQANRVTMAVNSSNIRGLSKDGMRQYTRFTESKNLPFSIHVNESPNDNQTSQARFGKNAIPTLAEQGVLNSHFIAAHCVNMTDEDISLLAQSKAGVSHNPVSNMYLGSGIAPIIAMQRAGIPLSLGLDGAASNNNQDMIETLKFAVLGQRAFHRDQNIISDEDALSMATTGGARVLNMEERLGKLAAGYKADLVLMRFDTANALPVHDPLAALVFSAGEQNVNLVMVGGQIVLDEGHLTMVDEDKLLDEAQTAARKLLKRANISIR